MLKVSSKGYEEEVLGFSESENPAAYATKKHVTDTWPRISQWGPQERATQPASFLTCKPSVTIAWGRSGHQGVLLTPSGCISQVVSTQ